MIIGIVGKAGSGKDTIAGMIPGARRFSFADPLKEFCADVFGWDRETLWGPSDLRNKPDPRYMRPDGQLLTPRFALQTLGTEWGRACCEDVWARLGVRRAQEWVKREEQDTTRCVRTSAWCDGSCQRPPVAVFPDCRFVNEAQAIREAGGQVWRVLRPGSGLAGAAALHPSEMEQESPEMEAMVTRTIYNNDSLSALNSYVLKSASESATL